MRRRSAAMSRMNPRERQLCRQLTTPRKVQGWLDSLPYNDCRKRVTMRTFRGVVRHRTAHCLEAALAAATILEQHGRPPILLDIASQDGLGHDVVVYKHRGRYGAVGRSRDEGLHGRKAVFRCVRDLVYSYYDSFIDDTGRITGYALFDLTTLDLQGVDWRLGRSHMWGLERRLIRLPRRVIRGSTSRTNRLRKRYRAFRRQNPSGTPHYLRDARTWM